MNENELFRVRVALIQAFLRKHGYDGILISRADNFAMATGGKRNYVYLFSDVGANSLFITKDGKAYFVGNTIEAPRVMEEELANLDCDSRDYLWFELDAAEVVANEFKGNIVSDTGAVGKNVHNDLAPLRALLTETEIEKYRQLGALAAEAMSATLDQIVPGMAEADIAAALVHEGVKRRCQVPVALVAADGRIERYRHPLPTIGPLLGEGLEEIGVQDYVMVVGCFVREGLVASITRFQAVGDVPAHIPNDYRRICGVDALMQEASVPGKTLGDVFAACQQAYRDLGFMENEWHHHHQGGATGYAGRTCKGKPGESFPILDLSLVKEAEAILGSRPGFGQAFAWNPSAPGVKSEDTFVLLEDGSQEIVTATPHLPEVDLQQVLGRPTPVRKSGIAGL